jgi:hypothetical protein
MKAEMSATVAAEPGDYEDEGATGATTTVGFGSAAAAASTVAAHPVMAIVPLIVSCYTISNRDWTC